MTGTLTMLMASQRLIASAVVLQTLELLRLRRVCSDSGIWRYAILAEEHAALPRPLRWTLARTLPYRAFLRLLGLRLVAACALLLGTATPIALVVLWVTTLLTNVRFRGSFNGGSDAMTMLVLSTVSIGAIAPHSSSLGPIALGYLAVQTVLSYFIAGVIKLKEPSWRDGSALTPLMRAQQYAPPRLARALFERPALRRVAAWTVIGFECSFPFWLVSPRSCALGLALGLCFHLANAIFFGLNRFVFAWLAAYPAVLWLSRLL